MSFCLLLDNQLASTLKLLCRIGFSTSIFLASACAQMPETGQEQDAGTAAASAPQTDLSNGSGGVVTVSNTVQGHTETACLVRRLAIAAGDSALDQALQRYFDNKRAGIVTDPLIAPETDTPELSPEEATAAYDCVADEIENTMAASPHAVARLFPSWRRIDGPPFHESFLGGRYSVVYANDQVETETEAGAFVDRGIAVGGILATPSFVIDATGIVSPGPMVLTEKMPRGFTSAFGNYRYTIIDAAGQVKAATNGANRELIALCERCTDQGADRLFIALLNGGYDDLAEPPPEAPRAVYEDPPLSLYSPPSRAFKSPDPGSFSDELEGQVLDPDASIDGEFIDPDDLDIELDPSVDLLAQ